MKKARELLKNNSILRIVFIIVLLGIAGVVWKSSLHIARNLVAPIKFAEIQTQKDDSETSAESDSEDSHSFEYTDAGVMYHPEIGSTVGPFPYIFADELYSSWDTIARYIGSNGKYGYLKRDGSLLTQPIFMNAASFEDGTAKVQEEKDRIYYIDSEGNRITKEYLDGSPTFEHQGSFCRVQTMDGKWGIINRKDELIFSGADSIEDLPMVTTLGSAVVDGSAVLFQLDAYGADEDGEEFKIIARYDSFPKISYVYGGSCAFVWDANDYMGVVDYSGEIIVPVMYQSIEYDYIGENDVQETLIFLAKDENGIVHVINMSDAT